MKHRLLVLLVALLVFTAVPVGASVSPVGTAVKQELSLVRRVAGTVTERTQGQRVCRLRILGDNDRRYVWDATPERCPLFPVGQRVTLTLIINGPIGLEPMNHG